MDKNTKLALRVIFFVVMMFGIAYLSVPLYDAFCRVTGLGGTTNKSENYSKKVIDREVKIRFNADIDKHLKWEFKPQQKEVRAKIGENKLAFYEAKNTRNYPVKGMATFNVTPAKAGVYFTKVECFCFQEQTLQPYEKVVMPVSFYVDPEINNDKNLDDITTITLSYTFFKAKD